MKGGGVPWLPSRLLRIGIWREKKWHDVKNNEKKTVEEKKMKTEKRQNMRYRQSMTGHLFTTKKGIFPYKVNI